ncbi:hypothetical protein C4E44_12275 [Pseudomonas sp. MWU12-2312b]|uniref:hypothetical protein n=1 Tax=Pseudomonas moorei TaxID=395599 RepID=UPI000D4F2F52|nr:hypothetical protein [Pseudomonas moorei]PPA03827.1 hypothetical protein C4E44_12275 [Pseudomonas sp. MWU12-2312b]
MVEKILISAFGYCPAPQSPRQVKFFVDTPIGMYLQSHVVSDLLIQGAFEQDFSYQETDLIWSLSSSHLCDEHLMEVFQKAIAGLEIEFLFKRYPHVYRRPREVFTAFCGKNNPVEVLCRCLLEAAYAWESATGAERLPAVKWSDFTLALLERLVDDGYADDELIALRLQHDLGV